MLGRILGISSRQGLDGMLKEHQDDVMADRKRRSRQLHPRHVDDQRRTCVRFSVHMHRSGQSSSILPFSTTDMTSRRLSATSPHSVVSCLRRAIGRLRGQHAQHPACTLTRSTPILVDLVTRPDPNHNRRSTMQENCYLAIGLCVTTGTYTTRCRCR